MKRMIVGLLSVCLLGSLTVLAADKAVKKEITLQEITAAGKLAKQDAGFTVTEADGTVVKVMSQKAAKEGEAPVVTNDAIEKLVGKDVKVVGMGHISKDKKTSRIKTVTSIEEAVAPAAPAAAAAPAAPVAPVAAPATK